MQDLILSGSVTSLAACATGARQAHGNLPGFIQAKDETVAGARPYLVQERAGHAPRRFQTTTLLILLQYARAAGVSTDVLIDDDLNLPANLPARRE